MNHPADPHHGARPGIPQRRLVHPFRVGQHRAQPDDARLEAHDIGVAAEGIEVRDHLDLGEGIGAIDMERGAKVSGSRFYFLTGPGAMLEFALIQFALSKALEWGLVPMIPPALVNPEAMEGTGFLGQAADDVYYLERDDQYLVGTAEVPLAAYHSHEILDAGELPIRLAGFSPAYRREAGSYGKDTRGIFRVHWFDKFEMFTYCRPEDAVAEHQRLLEHEKEFIAALGIPFEVLDVASGDLGASAARKYDCYGWVPSQSRYREITSTSNCTQFQARRLGIRTLVERIEDALIDCLGQYGITAFRQEGAPGIYVLPGQNAPVQPADGAAQWPAGTVTPPVSGPHHVHARHARPAADVAKIASIGLKTSHGFSYHGLALNGQMDLSPFHRINPCGFRNLQMTDIHRQAALSQDLDLDALALALGKALAAAIEG